MMQLSDDELKDFLDQKAEQYNNPKFIESDPIQIPHLFSKKEDIEISALLVATIAWGNRKSIISNGNKLVKLMGNQPHDFVLNYETRSDLKFVHRTFNEVDLDFFLRSMRQIYRQGSLESLFTLNSGSGGSKERIIAFRKKFLEVGHEKRSEKHLSNPESGSSAKRLNMFLRWMVRKDKKGVDFGLWDHISMGELNIPLDVHTGNIARKLGLLTRAQNDWKAVEEIREKLLYFDPADPAKYDFALFGLGAFEKF